MTGIYNFFPPPLIANARERERAFFKSQVLVQYNVFCLVRFMYSLLQCIALVCHAMQSIPSVSSILMVALGPIEIMHTNVNTHWVVCSTYVVCNI